MRAPLKPNVAVDTARIRGWTNRFGSYRTGVTRLSIEEWLGQFKDDHKDLAARVLDSVLFFGHAEIVSHYKAILQSLDGWHVEKSKRNGRWFFVARSDSAGESGDGMLYQFRIANNLDAKRHDEMFIQPRELVAKKLTAEDTVVFVDDFAGTGAQVCEAWNSAELAYSELVAGTGRVYLILIAATKTARDRISNETDISLRAATQLSDRDNLFSDKCKHFTKSEKNTVRTYNTRANRKLPEGYGNCGLLVVFTHRCPNNSIPILHAQSNSWTALFPRHE